MIHFQYHPTVLENHPGIVGGVILAKEMSNAATPPELLALYQDEQQKVLTEIGDTPLSKLESLAAWRSTFRGFGVNPTKYRSAVEALLRRLTKKGDIPSINTLVDIANLISIRYRLPVAFFDTRQLQGAIAVKISDGSERFTPLFEKEAEAPEAGEVVFADEKEMVIARRWCWRQSDESATREDTTTALITIEAQHEGGRDAVEAAMKDVLELVGKYAGGEFTNDLLSVEKPAFSA
ncbi:MAG: hypothetical protein DWQ07_00525 [Chloroflexi bacterium]|nr:MAG: hypothetical protein DWQ07_00525 [Chloroflexota bacterium]MBL1195817.1 hypothetical protein [Chloroflexota bacterium]NOH13109.1 hypothetical protein [Chloroflexota bacterium]